MPLHPQSPTVDQVRTTESLLIFDAVHPLHVVALPHVDGAELVDVAISFHGERSPYFTFAGVPFFLPAGVHMYFAPSDRLIGQAIDLTPVLVGAIREQLRALDPALFRAAYREALDTAVAVEGAPGLDLSINPQLLAADVARIPSLVATPAGDLIDQLGSRSVGLGGSLHVFNWLFNYIALQPISLAALLRAVANPPFDVTLGLLRRPRLVVTHGSIVNIGRPDPAPSGAVRLTLEAVFHNPLEDELDELERKIRLELVDIQRRFRPGSPLMQAVANIDDSGAHIVNDVATLTALIASARAEVTALRADAADIAARIAAIPLPTPVGL
jgi:hypothetical protein